MNALSLFVQFIIALPKLWAIVGAIFGEVKKAQDRKTEERQQEAQKKLEESKPKTEERRNALRDWVNSDRG